MKRGMLWAGGLLLLILVFQAGRMWPDRIPGHEPGSRLPAGQQQPAAPAPAPTTAPQPATVPAPAAQAPVSQAPASPAPAPAAGPSCKPGQAGDYFPYQTGTQAAYAGLGNEYASYKVKVIGQAAGKVEWRRDTGGTVAAEVFAVAPGQVTRIFREGEAYDNTPRINLPPNQSEILLKNPIQAGTQWTSGNTTYTIQSVTATVQALNQTLTCAVLVEAQSPTSLMRTYFHKQYGIVLTVFDPNGNPVESRLSSFTP